MWDSYQALKSEKLLDAENGAERRWGSHDLVGFITEEAKLADLCCEIKGEERRTGGGNDIKESVSFLFMVVFTSH